MADTWLSEGKPKTMVTRRRSRRTSLVCALILLCMPAPRVASSTITVEFRRGVPQIDQEFVGRFLQTKFAEDIALGMEKIYDPPFDKFDLADQMTAYADLNGDGIAEMLFRVEHPSTCGSVGCQTFIFQKQNGRWTEIGEFYTGHFAVMDGTTQDGWQAIYSFNMCAVWNGRMYEGYMRNRHMNHVFASCKLD